MRIGNVLVCMHMCGHNVCCMTSSGDGLASPEKPLVRLLDALFEVAVEVEACAVTAEMAVLLTISPRTNIRPPYAMGPPVHRMLRTWRLVAPTSILLRAFSRQCVEHPSAFYERPRHGRRESCSLANTLPLWLGCGTRANRTYQRTQRVAGASAGGSTDARYLHHTRS